MSPESRTAPPKAKRSVAAEGSPGALSALTFVDDRFMLALVTGAVAGGTPRVWLHNDQEGTRQRLTATPIAAARDGRAAVLLLGSERKPLRAPVTGSIAIETAGGGAAIAAVSVAQANVSPEAFGEGLRGAFDAQTRAALLERVVARTLRSGGTPPDTAGALTALHEATRERLPAVDAGASAVCAARVEAIWRVDGSSFYVEGWAFDRAGRLGSLRLLSPEGRRVELLPAAFRYPRPDVCEFFGVPAGEKLGFIAHVELPEESAGASGWVLQGERRDGEGFEVEVPPMLDEPLGLRTTILNDVELDAGDGTLLRGHVAPAMTRLQRRLADAIEIDAVDQHGEPPADPEVTIVVPLYRRIEFLEHQLAQFVHDPEIHAADLLYVLDSPEDAARLRTVAGHLHDLYGLPFRVAMLSANGGFSTVNNLGASIARGRRLLLLNSDVLPAAPGWLSRMTAFLDAHPEAGAVAPKLLYEDDSIQHAGLFFERLPGGSWSNEHYYKGLHRAFEPAGVTRAVPAVTGACLLVDAELYRELGGLRGVYVRGDYEDSDLCLRLREQGRECWYLADVELYHLEGQSYPTPERTAASRYNQWLHGDLWDASLAALERAS
ncbi:MAG TPA: glycosyltransferase [Conexibacter sp.]|nr:glycosyltransferase [Conexibacter sp.]